MKAALIGSLLLAVGTSVLAWWPGAEVEVGPLDRKGELLTPGGQRVDSARVASLRVVDWDAEKKEAAVFEVARQGDGWVIPSHFDYPADGGTRVGNTAGVVLNVPRGALVTDDSKRHEELGVLDPLQEGASGDGEGRGKRITLKDQGGALLVDLVVGKRAEHADVQYVREMGDDAVYTAQIRADFSTRFKDWVETDPLKVKRWHIRGLRVEDYSVDEESGTVEERAETHLRKGEDDDAWSAAVVPEGKEVDEDAIGKLLTEITNLKLVGVRPYHRAWLNERGFYLTREGTLKGNEGAVVVRTRDGVAYHLFFGEIALGDEQDQSAEAAAGRDDGGEDEGAESADGHNRYMAVFVTYNPTLDEGRKKPEAGDDAPEPAAPTEPTEGEKTAKQAEARFRKFFYVIDDEAFTGLRPEREKLFKDPEPEEPEKTDEPGEEEAGETTKDADDAGTDEERPPAEDPEKDAPDDGDPEKTDDPPADEPKGDDPKKDDPVPDEPK